MKKNIAIFKDVVCEMEVYSSDIAMDYMGCHYVFCSEQCLERFRLNPHLYIGYPGSESPKHAGVEVLKKRKMKLAEALPPEVENMFIDYIGSMMGIHLVEVDGDSVTIVYDLMQATEAQIEKKITDIGLMLGDGMMEKIKRAFIDYIEEIEVESLEARRGSGGCHHH